MFFVQGKIQHLTWPTLTMIKIIQFPFLERFEFIFIFTWLLVIMPVICLYLWSAVRSIKVTLPKIKPTNILLLLLALYLFVNSELIDIYYTQLIQKMVLISGTTLLFGYIPLLFIISLIRQFIKKQKQGWVSLACVWIKKTQSSIGLYLPALDSKLSRMFSWPLIKFLGNGVVKSTIF